MVQLQVQQYKYGGIKHYSYPVRLIEQRPDCVIVHGPYGRPLTHPGRSLVDWPVPNESIEFHFTARPYSVSAGWNGDGSFRHYYCNVSLPATLKDGVLSSVDLDLDLIVAPDLTYRVDDEDEFEEHRQALGYPEEVVALAREGLAELMRLVEERRFPFDGSAFRLRDQLAR
ncbi:protein associated with RNAse G/E [Symbiobacterium terraclitae]|jgi:protein associated with RNAse G/E|uniref:Protein associated with RNAse G/E n=1 Tax=Symbiobacterium terraclitae TaxID=557451 RepID=A0ABS4JML7_9FIRM|nr:DUF402 domain-containing protein [Symbiobacterium terraclitae]MBP2016778.1 protein associated with RNAse G/E [Symbiobacterium terraclitae]